MIWLGPEITLLTAKEVADPEKAWWLSRVVILPQPPVRSRVIAVEGHQGNEKCSPWAFRFAFVGGIIIAKRWRLVRALRIRPDVFFRAGCLAERYDAFDMDLESIYASADFCIVPSGDAFSSRRTFDALRMGCVPVLTNPLMLLPFTDQIEYDNFVLYIDSRRTADINAQSDHIVGSSENMGCSGRSSYFVTKTTSDRGGEITGDGRLHIRRWCTTRGRGCEYALVSSESYVYCSARGEDKGVRRRSHGGAPFSVDKKLKLPACLTHQTI